MTGKKFQDLSDGVTSKPSVLIIGGLGFIGRHLAHYLQIENLTSHYRLVDKVLPQLAHLSTEHTEPCSQSHFLQADASREASYDRIFSPPAEATSPETFKWDYVVNLGGETGYGQTHEIYNLKTTQLSIALGKEAAKRNVKAFVEVSSGAVYAAGKTPRVESDKLKPWLKFSKAKLDAEAALSRTPGLNLVILRTAAVYGDYDSGIIAKALCLARVYEDLDKELKWLWTEELKLNTVWVGDAVAAIWAAADWRSKNKIIPNDGTEKEKTAGGRRPTLLSRNSKDDGENSPASGTPIFNIVDHGSMSQGQLAKIVSEVFEIKTGFHGTLISQFARMNLEHVIDELNEEVLQPWADLLQENGITRPGPLSPFLEKDLLKDNDLSLDGGLFEKTVGFRYKRPGGLDVRGVREMVESYERMGWWP